LNTTVQYFSEIPPEAGKVSLFQFINEGQWFFPPPLKFTFKESAGLRSLRLFASLAS